MRARWASRALLACTALTLLGAPPASARTAGLSIGPARIDARVQPGELLPAVQVHNGTDRALDLHAFVVPAEQDISGLPAYEVSAESLREGARIARARPSRFTLAPNGARHVRARVVGGPRVGIGSYGVLVFSAVETDGGARGKATVSSRVRLSANLLLRYPGAAQIDGVVTALRAEQAGKGALRFVAPVKNRGNIHAPVTARLVIRDAEGRVRARPAMPGGNVLPGATREMTALMNRPRLEAGTYHARVDVRVGERRSHETTTFTLVGPNELPTPELTIARLDPPSTPAGDRVRARIALRSTGTAPVSATVTAVLSAPGGGARRRRARFELGSMKPGAQDERTLDLGEVPAGTYAIAVQARSGDRVLAERSVTFTTTLAPSWWDRIRDWVASHVEVLVAAWLLTLVAGALALILVLRRRRRTDEPPVAPPLPLPAPSLPPAPVVAAPPPPPVVATPPRPGADRRHIGVVAASAALVAAATMLRRR